MNPYEGLVLAFRCVSLFTLRVLSGADCVVLVDLLAGDLIRLEVVL